MCQPRCPSAQAPGLGSTLAPNHRPQGPDRHHAAHAQGPFGSPAGVPEPRTYTRLPAPEPCAHAPHTRTQDPTQVKGLSAPGGPGLPGGPSALHPAPRPQCWGWRPRAPGCGELGDTRERRGPRGPVISEGCRAWLSPACRVEEGEGRPSDPSRWLRPPRRGRTSVI